MFCIVHKVNGYCPSERKKREEIILTASAQVLKLGPTYHTFPLLFPNKKRKPRHRKRFSQRGIAKS